MKEKDYAILFLDKDDNEVDKRVKSFYSIKEAEDYAKEIFT